MSVEPPTALPASLMRLRELTSIPKDTILYNNWLYQGETIDFMDESIHDDEIILYASMRGVFVVSILVPCAAVSPPDIEDLRSWGCNPFDSWGLRGDGSSVPPLVESRTKTIAQGEPIVFCRSFDGVSEYKHYIELSQQFAHLTDIHFMPEHHGWCRLNSKGNIERVIQTINQGDADSASSIRAILAKRTFLEEYAEQRDLALLRMFEFTRYRANTLLTPAAELVKERMDTRAVTCYRLFVEPENASFSRGFQTLLLRSEQLGSRNEFTNPVKFTVRDEHNEIREISYSPDVDPLIPAFFSPEVLLEYKSDYEKYTLDERSICRHNSWCLKSYDINESGQVHTYLAHLNDLPYEEQLRWKRYNQAPNGPISRRAFEWDIMDNSKYKDDDPLLEMKKFLKELDCKWWKIPAPDTMNCVHYPATTSNDEWKKEIRFLDQLLIEGLQHTYLKEKAKDLGREPNSNLKSIRLLEECLLGLKNYPISRAMSTIEPLHQLHLHRNKLSHATTEATTLKEEAIKNHGSYRNHYRHLVTECLAVFKELKKLFSDWD